MLFSFTSNCFAGPGSRKTLRKAVYPEMEKRLYAWFCRQRSRHVPISYEIMCEKAKQIYAETYGSDNFVASRGWIVNFKNRHGLRALKICGEKLSNNEEAVEPFKRNLAAKIKNLNLSSKQIYNADESALYWKILPEKTMVRSNEKCAPGRKISKERVTFLCCTNADGSHKLKPLVIGKAKNPRAFKNVQLPVEYRSSSNAWMTTTIFQDWFHSSFIRQVRRFLKSEALPEKAILIVDNATSHGNDEALMSDDRQIITFFLPPNCTALIQPLDQNAIRLTKLFYRKSLLAHILSSDENDVAKLLKQVTLKDAVYLLYNAWQKVSPQAIKKCWNKILLSEQSASDYDDEDLIPLAQIKNNSSDVVDDVRTVTEMLNSLANENMTETEVNSWIQNDEELLPIEEGTDEVERDSDIEQDQGQLDVRVIQHIDALKAFNVGLQWCEENNMPMNDLLAVRRLQEAALLLCQQRSRQMKITEFFK